MAAAAMSQMSAPCVLYLKGQSQGCWLPLSAGEAPRENFDEYCEFVERIISQHDVRRVIWVSYR